MSSRIPVPKWMVNSPAPDILQTLIAYHLHEQTGRSTVWANGRVRICRKVRRHVYIKKVLLCTSQNSGLVNFVPKSCLPFVQISFIFRKHDREGVKMASSMTLKKWNTNFRLEHSVRKNRTTFSDVPLLSEICHQTTRPKKSCSI